MTTRRKRNQRQEQPDPRLWFVAQTSLAAAKYARAIALECMVELAVHYPNRKLKDIPVEKMVLIADKRMLDSVERIKGNFPGVEL